MPDFHLFALGLRLVTKFSIRRRTDKLPLRGLRGGVRVGVATIPGVGESPKSGGLVGAIPNATGDP